MEIESTEKINYINTFIGERPRNGIDSPHARILSAIKLNEELAEYFKDRALVEDTYAKNIAKLSKKHYITSKLALGSFLPIWEMLQMELSRLAAIHSEYASIITQEIEQPLRSSIQNHTDYTTIQQAEELLQKVAREFDDLETKIQKCKKSSKGESKALEYIKQQDQKLLEWRKDAPKLLQQYQNIDEARLDNFKSTVHKFENIQQTHAERVIELTGNSITAASSLHVDDEIASFCASYTSTKPSTHLVPIAEPVNEAPLVNLETAAVEPEPSMSESSLKQPTYASSTKKEKKGFFTALASIRRKPKSDTHQPHSELHIESNRQRSLSHSESIVESLHSINTHSTDHEQYQQPAHDLIQPSSPSSQNPPPLRSVASFNGSFTNNMQPPLVQVDSEGYSIPPPDRRAWVGDGGSDSFIDTEDVNSDAGSMFSSPRIRVHIKNEAVTEEDASESAVALSRISTLLKENNSPTPRRLRGRREMRATQLYSVVDQNHLLSQINETPSIPNSEPLTNPFEIKEPDTSMNVHITETVHLFTKGGIVEKSGIWGEVSIEYDGPVDPETPVCFQLLNHDHFEKLETTEFASQHDGDTFILNTALYHDKKQQVCIKYQTKLDTERVPLSVKPMWKCDADKSRLLVKYQPMHVLDNVVFMTSVTGNVQNALSIPAGELVLDQHAIRWHLGSIDPQESMIKAQFTTLDQGTPQSIAIRFELRDTLLTDVDVQQQDMTRIASVTKTVKTGKYVAEM